MWRLTALAVVALALGCDGDIGMMMDDQFGDVDVDVDVDAEWQGDLLLQEVRADCAGTAWDLFAKSIGPGGTADVMIAGPGGIEDHTLVRDDVAPDGSWATLRRRLEITAGEWSAEATTQYSCDDEGALSWRLELRDLEGDLHDCAAWGADPQSLVEGEDCRVLY